MKNLNIGTTCKALGLIVTFLSFQFTYANILKSSETRPTCGTIATYAVLLSQGVDTSLRSIHDKLPPSSSGSNSLQDIMDVLNSYNINCKALQITLPRIKETFMQYGSKTSVIAVLRTPQGLDKLHSVAILCYRDGDYYGIEYPGSSHKWTQKQLENLYTGNSIVILPHEAKMGSMQGRFGTLIAIFVLLAVGISIIKRTQRLQNQKAIPTLVLGIIIVFYCQGCDKASNSLPQKPLVVKELYDCGVIKGDKTVTRHFEIQNISDFPIGLISVTPDCGACTTVTKSPKSIPPKSQATIEINYHAQGRRGPGKKSLLIKTDCQEQQEVVLNYRVNVHGMVLWPKTVDFGTVSWNTQPSEQVMIYIYGPGRYTASIEASLPEYISVSKSNVVVRNNMSQEQLTKIPISITLLPSEINLGGIQESISLKVVSLDQPEHFFNSKFTILANKTSTQGVRSGRLMFGKVQVGKKIKRNCTVYIDKRVAAGISSNLNIECREGDVIANIVDIRNEDTRIAIDILAIYCVDSKTYLQNVKGLKKGSLYLVCENNGPLTMIPWMAWVMPEQKFQKHNEL